MLRLSSSLDTIMLLSHDAVQHQHPATWLLTFEKFANIVAQQIDLEDELPERA